MNVEKDYYAMLGLAPFAEDIVIKSAYKALAQRYHPDKSHSDERAAKAKMQEINEAYSVLGDAVKKKQYDAQFNSGDNSSNESEGDDLNDALSASDRDWELACNVYPQLEKLFARLHKVSSRLSATFKIRMLESKQFSNSANIADVMEQNFLATYYGNNDVLLRFARELIHNGSRDAAKALNQYVRVIGVKNDREANDVIGRVKADFGLVKKPKEKVSKEKIKSWATALWLLAIPTGFVLFMLFGF